jgi:glycosyltransferase involved in cell wall biosynthesis
VAPIVLRRGKLVNWVMDLFPETAIELGVMPSSTMLESLTLALRNWSHRRAALTICPTASMARYLREEVPGAGTVAVVHHWSDGGEIHPVAPEDNALRREWGLNDAFVVGYSGNFGRAHEFETLLNAAERLKDRRDIRFLLIGDGQQRARVEREAAERGLANILFKPLQPSAILSESLGVADVHVVSLLPSLEHCIVPSKFYGILAAARPTLFVGAADGEVATAVRRSNCGISVAPGDVERFVDAVMRLKNDPQRRAAMGANARRLLESGHAMPIGVDVWRRAVAELLPSGWPQPLPTFADRVPT